MFKLSVKTREFFRRQKPPEFLWRLAGYGITKAMTAWMSTLNFRCYRYDDSADPACDSYRGPIILVFWHEYIPFPVYLRPNSGFAMLLSKHQDAEILEHVAAFAGLQTVRGSTSKGGTAALKEMIAKGKGSSLAITPDGPRGPRRSLAQGCIYLSSRLQIPIVPLGVGYDRPWRNRSAWDKFALPRPFSRARALLGPKIQVPSGLDRPAIEQYRQWVEATLNELTVTAEQWAERKIHVDGQPISRCPPSQHSHGNQSATEEPEYQITTESGNVPRIERPPFKVAG